MNTHNKVYSTDEEFLHRMAVFSENLDKIAQWNGEGNEVFGVTKFADLTQEEFRQTYLIVDAPEYDVSHLEELDASAYDDVPTATSFDWRTKNAVTPVKNQGQCGSCWAFSATENIESVYFLAGHSIPDLSPQQIVDCDTTCYGCNGGWPYLAFEYVIPVGQDSESSYPYTARDGTCKYSASNVAAKISSYNKVSNNEHTIQSTLPNVSPYSICVDAAKWYLYQGGIMTPSQCGQSVDHCVQLVGFDASGSTPYWIVRNSWGTGWGQQGYIYLEMYQDTCAMADYVTTAVSH
jgi:C1A family cysteine protease